MAEAEDDETARAAMLKAVTASLEAALEALSASRDEEGVRLAEILGPQIEDIDRLISEA